MSIKVGGIVFQGAVGPAVTTEFAIGMRFELAAPEMVTPLAVTTQL